MKKMTRTTHSAQETVLLGKHIARHLSSGDIVCLIGDLGSGKTTLVKGLAQGLKIDHRRVNSPTFVLINIYQGKLPLYHFDLYRLDSMKEINLLGYEEFLYGEGISVIEWADKMHRLFPQESLNIIFTSQHKEKRVLEVEAVGKRYLSLLRKIASSKSKK